MTNFEWLVKNETELVKGILAQHLSKEKGIPKQCSDIDCRNCDFDWNSDSLKCCRINTKKWLESEYGSPCYKGDIVDCPFFQMTLVKEDIYNDDDISITRYWDPSGKYHRDVVIKKEVKE